MRYNMLIDVPDDEETSEAFRERAAMAIEEKGLGRVRFVASIPGDRATVKHGDVIAYKGEMEYIPCNLRGKCLDGEACPGCAYADVLARLYEYERALAPTRGEVAREGSEG